MLFDTHSHILPAVDDGAQNIEISLKMLKQEREQGVSFVLATPHFYADRHSYEEHLEHIKEQFSLLKSRLNAEDYPEVFLGHENRYYNGISRSDSLDALCIDGTKYILIELPFNSEINDRILNDIYSLHYECGYEVILAHIERYCRDKKYKTIIEMARNGDVLLQICSSFLFFKPENRQVTKLLKENLISFIGSDAHSDTIRPVIMKPIVEFIQKVNPEQLKRIEYYSGLLLDEIRSNND